MTPDDAKKLVEKIADRFSIGQDVRTHGIILANIDNVIRRSNCLSKIEAHHTSMLIDEDGDEYEASLLNWGEEPEEYIETYKAILDA